MISTEVPLFDILLDGVPVPDPDAAVCVSSRPFASKMPFEGCMATL